MSPQGIGARPDPLYVILCRSHWHRGAHGFNVHAFSDDLQVYGHAAQHEAAFLATRMSTCIESVKAWMSSNRLRLKPFEDGADMVGLQPSSAPLQQYRNEGVGRQPSTRWLCPRSGSSHRQWDDAGEARQPHFGCLLSPAPTTANHPSILTTDAAHALVRALIHTRIDYCNGLLASCPRYLTDKLQLVLRAAARMVLQLPYRSSVSEVMHRQLHWLDVVDRVNYKIGLLVYKCLHGLAPGYHPISAFRLQLSRSSSRFDRLYCTSHEPKQRHWVHEVSTPCLLCGTRSRTPVDLRDSGLSLHSFRTKLKSSLFHSWFFSVFIHVLYYCLGIAFFFAVRANVMFISWRIHMSELNWINDFKSVA